MGNADYSELALILKRTHSLVLVCFLGSLAI